MVTLGGVLNHMLEKIVPSLERPLGGTQTSTEWQGLCRGSTEQTVYVSARTITIHEQQGHLRMTEKEL